mmetsp:Transcript_45218/g.60005  ORF Transcript_45218/g.60005 Transcript_45218/m.60005 type:complete len:139 (-) Transcript_45218:699-1115(-)
MQSVNNFSGLCVRLLFSASSGVLCVHVFNLNPFTGLSLPSQGSSSAPNCGTQTLATFRKPDAQKKKLLQSSLYRRSSASGALDKDNNHSGEASSPADEKADNNQTQPELDEVERLRTPVFLNRNRRQMKQLRKHLWQE